MRSAARQQEAKPPPATRPELEAGMGAAIAEHRAAVAEFRAGIRALDTLGCDPQLIAELGERLRLAGAGLFDSGIHLEEARGGLAGYTVTSGGEDHIYSKGYEKGLAAGLERAAKALIPGPRHRRASDARQPGEGQRALFSVKALAPVAAAFWAARRAIPAHTAHQALRVKLAALITGAAAGSAAAAVTAVMALAPVTAPAATGPAHGHGANPAASVVASGLIPSPSLAGSERHARNAARKGGKKALLSAGGQPVLYGPAPDPSSSASSSPSPAASVQAGPAQISVSTPSLDLSILQSVTFQVIATGSGWSSWSVSTTGSDLDFSPSHGILQAGQSVTVTVKVDPAQLLDGNSLQSFTIGTNLVTVTLPGPVPVPSVSAPVPSVSVPVPSIVPSVLPS